MNGRAASRETHVEVAIVGSGFSGLCMAIRLKRLGRDSFVILEQASALGGTWQVNRYPGSACDVPAHLYSFSFEPNPNWTRVFAERAEIQAYLERCAAKYGLAAQLELGTKVTRAEYDERRALWRVETERGKTFTARYLVFGLGGLSRPAWPAIPGVERFRGPSWHSSEWDQGLAFAGQRVAVVGTGASAIQIVPHVAAVAARLSVFQRTPPWVIPKADRPVTRFERRLFARFPWIQRLMRFWIYVLYEFRCLGFVLHPGFMRAVAWAGRSQIRRQIRDPELRRRLVPDYVPGCKRILMADDYYPALQRPNVELVTEPIASVTASGIRTTDGEEREFDAIVYATGFHASDRLTPLEVIGPDGARLDDVWKERKTAYLGCMVSGFPNLFLLLGPNTGLGHSSVVFMIEAQVEFVLGVIGAVERRGARAARVRAAAERRYNDELAPRLRRAVWATGCRSWYLDEKGQNSTLWPSFTFEFWRRTRRLCEADFEFDSEPARQAERSGALTPGTSG